VVKKDTGKDRIAFDREGDFDPVVSARDSNTRHFSGFPQQHDLVPTWDALTVRHHQALRDISKQEACQSS
jgi:hypothetical protein